MNGKGLTYSDVLFLRPAYTGVLPIFKDKSTLINLGHTRTFPNLIGSLESALSKLIPVSYTHLTLPTSDLV